MTHSYFKHIRNKGHVETKCLSRRCNSVEIEQELGLGCAAGSWELFRLQEAVLCALLFLEGISAINLGSSVFHKPWVLYLCLGESIPEGLTAKSRNFTSMFEGFINFFLMLHLFLLSKID